MVVPVLMTSCQVSDQSKTGPETPHSTTTAMASTKVDDLPTCRSTHRANRAKSGVAGGSSDADLTFSSSIHQPTSCLRILQRGLVEYSSHQPPQRRPRPKGARNAGARGLLSIAPIPDLPTLAPGWRFDPKAAVRRARDIGRT